jgi:CheY-like chemotaxis protein
VKAFLSSTYLDLVEHRQKAAEAIERLGQQGIRMEVFGARPSEASDVCREEIAEADILIGIYAHRYGYIPAGSAVSITELEYDYAVSQKKPVFCFVIDNDYPWRPGDIDDEPSRSKLRRFKEKIDRSIVRSSFTAPDDLAFKVAASVGRYLITKKVKDELTKAGTEDVSGPERSKDQVSRRAARLLPILTGAKLLLVNDFPSEMIYVISIFESLGIDVTVAKRSTEALSELRSSQFDAVISDMCRDDIPDEGIRFVDQMRSTGVFRPTIFTLAQYDPSRGTPPYAFGITNRVDELLNLTFDVIERSRG